MSIERARTNCRACYEAWRAIHRAGVPKERLYEINPTLILIRDSARNNAMQALEDDVKIVKAAYRGAPKSDEEVRDAVLNDYDRTLRACIRCVGGSTPIADCADNYIRIAEEEAEQA